MPNYPGFVGRVMEKKPQSCDVGDREKKVDMSEVLILFHEKIRAVTEEEVSHYESQFRHREKEGVAGI